MISINVPSIFALISSFFIFSLGIFIWLKKRKDKLYLLFFISCGLIALILFGTFQIFNAKTQTNQLMWARFLYIGLILLPAIYYHISLYYRGIKNQQIFIIIAYTCAIFFLIFSHSSLFLTGIYKYNFGISPSVGLLHHVFLIYFVIFNIGFFINLYKAIKPLKKIKLYIAFFILCISWVFNSLNFLTSYGIEIYPFFAIFSVPSIGSFIYLIVKQRSLNVTTIVLEIFVTILNTLLVIDIFINPAFYNKEALFIFRILIATGYIWLSIYLIKIIYQETNHHKEIQGLAQSLQKANKKLTKTNIQLQELDRQKNEFLAIATHHLRTPLSIVKGYLSLLEEGTYGKIPKKALPVLNTMDQANNTLITLVDDFLNVTLLEQHKVQFFFKHTDINKIIQEVIDSLKKDAKDKNLNISWKPNNNIKTIYIDENKIRHALFNLLHNAIKYSEHGTISISLSEKNNGISIKVKDKGIGFEKDDSVNLFQKFYRGKNVERVYVTGTGLGLYVTKKFIERHHGEVWAKSTGLGKGSEFGFWIPKNLDI